MFGETLRKLGFLTEMVGEAATSLDTFLGAGSPGPSVFIAVLSPCLEIHKLVKAPYITITEYTVCTSLLKMGFLCVCYV